MTAVLSATDALRRDRHMSLDDDLATSNVDWQARYNEVLDMLSETRTELDDFHHASKELEAELENELQRTEKAQEELKNKVNKAETEREEWKGKFMSLQTTHNTTTTSLQRELDKLRQEHQSAKVQLRELEMGNDDLERNERAVSSSLADMEAKYSRALEEKILLEHELLEKASLEEDLQRLKDELRDANVEISILKDQLANALVGQKAPSNNSQQKLPPLIVTSDDNLLNTAPPPDLQLSELSPDSSSSEETPSKTIPTPKITGQSAILQRVGLQTNKNNNMLGSPTALARSTTLSHLYHNASSSPRTPISRTPALRNPSAAMSTMSSTSMTAKNKGVQMVSEMRARVRNLEQKIHTRVPRLRMGSITGRTSATTAITISTAGSSSPSTASNASTAKTSLDSLANRKSADSRSSNDSDSGKLSRKESKGDSSGWVLIMEDSPSPHKDKEKERRDRRRLSSPTAPTSFRPSTSVRPASPAMHPTSNIGKPNLLAQSTMNTGIRRPQSRLSAGSLSTATTASSIPTPVSRPNTPTFLPVPSGGFHTSSPSMTGIGTKRSKGPVNGDPYSAKRSSLGMSTAGTKHEVHGRERPNTMPPLPRYGEGSRSGDEDEEGKDLPHLPSQHSNVTVRQSSGSRLPATSSLAQSRIGRPSGNGVGGRKSTGESGGHGRG